eukprot:GFUD01004101.1.p1 GENE.GFUD01004101.1~~GFUD01004101.1.p1  ORF type:complete len:357 (+),score=118.37 GFUD01004101.1:96-1166(+)
MAKYPHTFVEGFHDASSVAQMTYRQVGKTDMVVSNLSFGASSLGGVFRATDDEESVQLVETAVKQGINYIDTAPWYGQGRSETVLGKALKRIPRKAFYLATKVGRYELEIGKMFDFSRNRILKSVDESLERLGLDYIDLIQVHDVEFCHSLAQLVQHTLPALLDLKAAGKVRYIGLTGYSLDALMRLIPLLPPGSVDTVLTYCRCTLIDQALLGSPLQFFRLHNIGIINASPVSMGLLSNRGPPTWHPATASIKAVCKKATEFSQSSGQDITDLAVLWTLALTEVPTTLISTASILNMEKNLALARQKMTEEQRLAAEKLISEFFKFLSQNNWENIEVSQYWDKMGEEGIEQNTDL